MDANIQSGNGKLNDPGFPQKTFGTDQTDSTQSSQEEKMDARRLTAEITERRKVEAALRKSQEILNSLFEAAPDASILVDPAGKIVRVNRQAEDMFGYSRDELIGTSIDRLLPERYLIHHSRSRDKFFKNLSIRTMGAGLDLHALRKDGSEFPVDIMLSPIQTEDGNLVISSIRDITEQKRLQNELAETQRILLESVEAERMTLSQDLHDGPVQDLYAAVLALGGIRAHIHSTEGIEELEVCQENIQSVIQTLREICGELRPPVLTHFGLEKAIRSHARKFQSAHPDPIIELRLDSDGNLLSDRVKLALYRVYQNSMSNILRHAQARKARIEFQILPGLVTLKIMDDGRGFHIPHRWVELARSGHFGLVGMSERVETIGGRLKVVSAEGGGTTIQVDVPIPPG